MRQKSSQQRIQGVLAVLSLLLVLVTSACATTAPAEPAAEPTSEPVVEATTEPTAEPEPTEAEPVEEPTEVPAPATEALAEEEAAQGAVTLNNCGMEITFDSAPERAVTMNQAATEIMLALGLEDRMVGTAYMDDEIWPDYAEAYESVPVLSDEYPSQEVLFAEEPDFVYGAYSSAFGEEAAGSREELLDLGIGSYLSQVACEERALRPEQATFETVYGEIRDIGRIFQVEDRAEALIAEMQGDLDEVMATIGDDAEETTIFWYDSGEDEPYAGACCGAPNMIIEAAGATNIFDDAEGSWAAVNWEEVVSRNPDAIVLIDADWDSAQAKSDLLTGTEAYSSIAAVQEENFIILPFSSTTLGVRNVAAVVDLAEALYPEKFQ